MANPKPNMSGLINYRLRKAFGIAVVPKSAEREDPSGSVSSSSVVSSRINDLLRQALGITPKSAVTPDHTQKDEDTAMVSSSRVMSDAIRKAAGVNVKKD